MDDVDVSRRTLGDLGPIEDELLQYLLSHLDASTLLRVRCATRILFTHASEAPLWRSLCCRIHGGHVHHTGSWRMTYWATLRRRQGRDPEGGDAPPAPAIPGFASAFLFARWQRAHINLSMFEPDDGCILVERRAVGDISRAEFAYGYDSPGGKRPLVILGAIDAWPAFDPKSDRRWSIENLVARYGKISFNVSH